MKTRTRNVYALQARPFILVKGHRLYAGELTALRHGTKVVCTQPKASSKGLLVKVTLDDEHSEILGGPWNSQYVEKPAPSVPRRRGYRLMHPNLGTVRK